MLCLILTYGCKELDSLATPVSVACCTAADGDHDASWWLSLASGGSCNGGLHDPPEIGSCCYITFSPGHGLCQGCAADCLDHHLLESCCNEDSHPFAEAMTVDSPSAEVSAFPEELRHLNGVG